ncbi:MAG: hypothetical protein ACOY35_13365 [Bacillota bacterium]
MTEHNNVVHLEQEMINKNTEIFIDITKILGQMQSQGLVLTVNRNTAFSANKNTALDHL